MSEINRKQTKKAIKDYEKYDWFIKQRELELMHPYTEDRDENVGGGKMQFGKNEGVANKAIKMATDRTLEELKLTKEAINIALNQADRETLMIVNELLFKDEKTAVKLAMELNISTTSVYRKTSEFVDLVYSMLRTIKK